MSQCISRISQRRKKPKTYQHKNPFGRELKLTDIVKDDSIKPIFTGLHYGLKQPNGHQDLMGFIRLTGCTDSGISLDENEYHYINELELNHRMHSILVLQTHTQDFVHTQRFYGILLSQQVMLNGENPGIQQLMDRKKHVSIYIVTNAIPMVR